MKSVLRFFTPKRPAAPPTKRWQELTDAELVAVTLGADSRAKEAFVEVVQRYQAAVGAVAFGTIGRMSLVDDVCQETFLYAWKKRHDLREPSKLKPWLMRIARNTAIDAARKLKDWDPLDDISEASLTAPSLSPEDVMATAEEEKLVWEALAELPELLRLPLVLFYQQGQSAAEVADSLDISPDAVRQRLHRGREAMKEHIVAALADQTEARLQGILVKARPSSQVVINVALAIGFLMAPAALAAGVLSSSAGLAATASGAATASTVSVSPVTVSTFMGTSSYLTAAATVAICVPLGWMMQNQVNPKPLMHELWAQSASTAAPRAPSSISGRTTSRVTTTAGSNPSVASPVASAGFSLEGLLALHDPIGELKRLTLHLKQCSLGEVIRLFPELTKITHPDVRKEALTELFGRWGELDPVAALEAQKGLKVRNEAYENIIWQKWAGIDLDAAMAAAKAGKSWSKHRQQLFVGLAMADPTTAVKRWKEFAPQGDDWDFYQALFPTLRSVSATQPLLALSTMQDMPANVLKNYSGDADILGPWIEKQGVSAIHDIQALPPGKNRDHLLAQALDRLAQSDPASAAETVRNLPSDVPRKEFARAVSRGLAKTDPVAAFRTFRDLMGSQESQANYGWLTNAGGQISAAQATTILSEMPIEQKSGFIASLMGSMSKEEGQAWLSKQSVSALDPEAVARAGNYLPQSEWGPYLARLNQLPPEQRDKGLKRYAEKAANQIMEDKSLTAEQQTAKISQLSPELQSRAARQLMSQAGLEVTNASTYYIDESGERHKIAMKLENGRYVEMKPDADKALSIFNALPVTTRQETAIHLVAQTAGTAPAKAAELLAQYPPAPENPATALLYENLASNWLKKDPLKTSEWIAQLPPGAPRDAAVVALVESQAKTDVEAAQQWAATLTDPVSLQRAAKALTPQQ